MAISRFSLVFNRGKIWTVAVVIWLSLFIGFQFYRVSPGGMDAPTRAAIFDWGKGPGMPPGEVYACVGGRSGFNACTKNEAIHQMMFLAPIRVLAAFLGSLFVPIIQPKLFIPLWFSVRALIENPYLAVPLWYLLLRGFVYLTEIKKDQKGEI